MKLISLTKDKSAMVDDEDYDHLSLFRWRAYNPKQRAWYASRQVYANGKQRTLLMHRQIMNAPAGMEVDHVDGDGLNNQRSNLRICTRSQNARNQRPKGLSRFKGVTYHPRAKKWVANIFLKRHQGRYLGLFASEKDAALAYNEAALEAFGEFARLNVVEPD